MLLEFLPISLFYLFLLLSIYYFCKYKNFLIHNSFGLPHKKKKFTKDKIILLGGVFFFIAITTSVFLFSETNDLFFISPYLIPFLIVGIFADIKKNYSIKIRFIAFIFISASYLVTNQIFIESIDLKIVDTLLKYNLFAILFFSFCIALVINGVNFIDGLNGNCILYIILVLISLLFIIPNQNEKFFIITLLISCVFFLILNLNEKVFLGDSGAYVLGFFISVLLINYYIKFNLNSYYIAGLLLYPAVEVGWSMLRKALEKKQVSKPDSYHLHELIFRKFSSLLYTNIQNNILATFYIFIFNMIFIFLITVNSAEKVILVKLISRYILVYVTFYLIFRSFAKK